MSKKNSAFDQLPLIKGPLRKYVRSFVRTTIFFCKKTHTCASTDNSKESSLCLQIDYFFAKNLVYLKNL